jgi:hypothetical protein
MGDKKMIFYWVKGLHNNGSGHVLPLPPHAFYLEIYFEAHPKKKPLLRPE